MITRPTWRGAAVAVLTSALLMFGPPSGTVAQTRPATQPASKPARPPPPPVFAGAELPVPRRQHDPWTPPRAVQPPADPRNRQPQTNALPAELITATKLLFEQGMADPRGCEYWEVGIVVGGVWGGAGIVQTHAFVLPPDQGAAAAARTTQSATRFAVCWNGLVYPVQSIGQRADVAEDVRALLRADREERTHPYTHPDFLLNSSGAVSEWDSISHRSKLPLKCCMLLRLGEIKLATDFWTEGRTQPAQQANNNINVADRDPYLALAADWTWAMFDRAVCAHMRGDDRLAMLSARQLVLAAQAVEATAEQHGFERPRPVNDQDVAKKLPYLDFLDPAPRLLADEERRVKQGTVERAVPAPNERFPDRAGRIAALVRDLEEVAARQWGQPGGVSLDSDPVIEALVKEGTNAVEPLLTCLESDHRLTRSVSFGRDFSLYRHLIGVDEAAYSALTQILQTYTFGPLTAQGYHADRGVDRRAVATEVRAVWEKTRDGPGEERWYATLADDHATPEQWAEAAGRIVQAAHARANSDWFNPPEPVRGQMPALKGESLRTKHTPTVSQLMARRIEQLSATNPASSSGLFNLHRACNIALYLGAWDGIAAAPVLLREIAVCRAYPIYNASDRNSWAFQMLGRYIARMTTSGGRAESAEVLAAYADWVRTITPESVSDYSIDVFEPIWRFPNDPRIVAAAEWLFNDPSSPWRSLAAADAKLGRGRIMDILGTPLVGAPAVRTALLRGLKDTTKLGTVTLQENGAMGIDIEGAAPLGATIRYADDPLAPKLGTAIPIRACDLYGWRLSSIDGTPPCELYWPQEKRDAAVGAVAAFLERWGDRFAFNERQRALWEWPDHPEARMTFPRLDHPATEADVKAGRAIFSLGDGNDDRVRLSLMPKYPLKGRWTTLKEFPRQRQTFDPKTGKSWLQLDYEQVGLIWQAEEVLEGGHWRRYYGWVGHYRVAKVPAEEMEIVADDYRD